MGPPRELHAATTHSGREYRNNNSDPLSSAVPLLVAAWYTSDSPKKIFSVVYDNLLVDQNKLRGSTCIQYSITVLATTLFINNNNNKKR